MFFVECGSKPKTQHTTDNVKKMLKSKVGLLLGLAAFVVMCQMLLVQSVEVQKPHFINGKHNPEAHAAGEEAADAEVSPAKKVILDAVTETKVLVFSKSYCPYCKRAKALLEAKRIPYKAFEIDQEPNGGAVHAELKKMTNRNTVPNIWINGKPFGGSDDLQKAVNDAKLDKLLESN